MERSELFDLMGELQLYGMKAAFDEIMTTAVKRQHEPQRIIGDLLTAEINEKQARSIKYQLTIAKLPLAKSLPPRRRGTSTTSNSKARRSTRPSCATLPAANSLPSSVMPSWSAARAPAKPTWRSRSPEAAFDPAPAADSTTWSISSTASRTRPATPGRAGSPITSPAWTSSSLMNSAITTESESHMRGYLRITYGGDSHWSIGVWDGSPRSEGH